MLNVPAVWDFPLKVIVKLSLKTVGILAVASKVNNRNPVFLQKSGIFTPLAQKYAGFMIGNLGCHVNSGVDLLHSDGTKCGSLPRVEDSPVIIIINISFNPDKCLVIFLINHVVVGDVLAQWDAGDQR